MKTLKKSRAELVAKLVEDFCVEKGGKKATEIISCPGHFEEMSKRLTPKTGFSAAQDGRILRGGAQQGLSGAAVRVTFGTKRTVPIVPLNLKIGPITVTFSYRDGEPDVFWMRQIEPIFGETVPHAAMAEMLRLSLDDFDTRFAPQEVSTGLTFFIVPLRTRQHCCVSSQPTQRRTSSFSPRKLTKRATS